MKYINILPGFLFILPNFVGAQPSCSQIKESKAQYRIQLPEQTIHLIGWTHPMDHEMRSAYETLKKSAQMAPFSNCSTIQEVLKSHLKGAQIRLQASRDIKDKLQAIYDKNPSMIIGTEHGPEEWRYWVDENNKNLGVMEKMAQTVAQYCPALKTEAEDLASIMSPELSFAKSKGATVSVEPIESSQLINESTQALSPELLNFDPDQETMSKTTRKLFKQAQEKMQQGKNPSESEVLKIAESEKDPAIKQRLTRILKQAVIVFDLTKKRNNYIVDKALSYKKDVVIVIGSAHTQDLAEKIVSSCKNIQISPKSPQPKIEVTR